MIVPKVVSKLLILVLLCNICTQAIDVKSKGIEVIGAGYGRTGTMSLKIALNELGFEAYHMDQVLERRHYQFVVDAFMKGKSGWQAWFDELVRLEYKSTTDFPTCLLYKEQLKYFPEAKVILTVREPEEWLKSWKSLQRAVSMIRARPFAWFFDDSDFVSRSFGSEDSPLGIPECMPDLEDRCEPWYFPWISYPFGERLRNETACLERFERHIEEVIEFVQTEKLLVMHISEEWEPICDFLGESIPNMPFPKINRGISVKTAAQFLRVFAQFYPFIAVAIIVAFYHFVATAVQILNSPQFRDKIKLL